LEVKTALHTSGVECSVCFFYYYYRSLPLVRVGVNQCQWVIIEETKTYTQLLSSSTTSTVGRLTCERSGLDKFRVDQILHRVTNGSPLL